MISAIDFVDPVALFLLLGVIVITITNKDSTKTVFKVPGSRCPPMP